VSRSVNVMTVSWTRDRRACYRYTYPYRVQFAKVLTWQLVCQQTSSCLAARHDGGPRSLLSARSNRQCEPIAATSLCL
jgi:hypothetical protein